MLDDIGSSGEDERLYLQRRMQQLGKAMLWLALLRFTMSLDCFFADREPVPLAVYFINPMMWFAYWRSIGTLDYSAKVLHRITFAALFISLLVSNIAARFYLPSVPPSIGLPEALQEVDVVIALLQAFYSMDMVLQAIVIVTMRAAVLPSERLRTVRDTALLGLPVVWINTFGLGPWDPPGPFAEHNTPDVWWLTLVPALIWWVITVFVCSLISDIVYGLRRTIQQMKRLGPYTLGKKIGEGGMGMVFQASHALLRRDTAIKLISAEKAGLKSLRRFEQEVRLTARLTHPNTVTVFDYGHTPDGFFYYAMELLDGADLERVVSCGGPLHPGRVLKILVELAGALEEAHRIGLIHRDVKPSNVILCKQGGRHDVAKLVDFGLVKEFRAEEDPALTEPDALIGTPLYMAPESLKSPQTVGPAADIYSLGAVGFYLLTGRHVFEGETVVEVLGHHLFSEIPKLSERGGQAVPADIERLLRACLAKDPSERPSSALELRRALESCADYGSWSEGAARAWWAEHEDQLEERGQRRSDEPSVSATVLVGEARNAPVAAPAS